MIWMSLQYSMIRRCKPKQVCPWTTHTSKLTELWFDTVTFTTPMVPYSIEQLLKDFLLVTITLWDHLCSPDLTSLAVRDTEQCGRVTTTLSSEMSLNRTTSLCRSDYQALCSVVQTSQDSTALQQTTCTCNSIKLVFSTPSSALIATWRILLATWECLVRQGNHGFNHKEFKTSFESQFSNGMIWYFTSTLCSSKHRLQVSPSSTPFGKSSQWIQCCSEFMKSLCLEIRFWSVPKEAILLSLYFRKRSRIVFAY